jgi:ribosome-associated translation inhibitor RaiA
MGRKIQTSGLHAVGEIDRAKIMSVLSAFYDKIERIVNNELLLRAHFKAHEKEGARRKHSAHLRLSVPGFEIAATAVGWNILTALQEAVSKLEREALKRVKR